MTLPKSYAYPAILTYEPEQEISVEFPDLNCATSGVNDLDAFRSAEELLGLVLLGLEEDGEDIPAPTQLNEISLEPNQKSIYVEVYMPSVRLSETNRAVNRTVTLPAWLNAKVAELGLNCSQILQDQLKRIIDLQGNTIVSNSSSQSSFQERTTTANVISFARYKYTTDIKEM